ncbi:metallophosphoesterase [Vibrio maritimus]|uniref:metallophosphoesterase n=1 Tax=Vibrio maritimus TaxID=990268 RepID=UPI0040689585
MNRSRFTVLLLFSALASASLVGCNDDSSVSLGDPIPTAPTKKHGPDCDPSAVSQTIRFIHVADLHGHFGYREQFYSKIKQAHLSALDDNAYTLFTNGGDDYEKGTVAEQLSGGYATLEATQALAFDYRVIGNHDFAWGPEQLLEYSRDDVATVLASNTSYYGNDTEGFNGVDFAIAQVGCVKVGFFGMTSGPWNELDQEVTPPGDFIDDFSMRWDWNDRARELISAYGEQVDYMVMLSHLGHGTDTALAEFVDGIDLVLGGHTHDSPTTTRINNSTVVLPDFNAKGYTDITVTFDLATKTATTSAPQPQSIAESSPIDQTTQTKIDSIMGTYAPDASTEIAISQKQPSRDEVLDILHASLTDFTAPKTAKRYTINASFLNRDEIEDSEIWAPGSLTQEDFHNAYPIERQPSNTPGFSALYQVIVSGDELINMIESDTELAYRGPAVNDIDVTENYNIGLFKSAAWNPELFFNASYYTKEEAELIAEAWEIFDNYARSRTASCLYLDADDLLFSCDQDAPNTTSIWNFSDSSDIFATEQNQASSVELTDELGDALLCGSNLLSCGTTESLSVPALPDGSNGNIIKLGALTALSNGRFELSTQHAANGDFASLDRISNYTLVFDALWPASDKYRALVDANDDDGQPNIYLSPEGDIGVSPQYEGYFEPNTWYRIALVFFASSEGDVAYKLYADGEFIASMRYAGLGQLWAMDRSGLVLFTDTADGKFESGEVYLNSLMFTPRSLTSNDIAALGGVKNAIDYTPSVRTLSQSVERAYQDAPVDWAHKWVTQRAKFFKNRKK